MTHREMQMRKSECDRRRYARRLAAGVCPKCGGPRDTSGLLCRKDIERERQRKEAIRA